MSCLRRVDLRETHAYEFELRRIRGQEVTAEKDDAEAGKVASVRAIVEAVRRRGDAALVEFTAQFDGIRLDPGAFEMTEDDFKAALAEVDRATLGALERAHARILAFHEKHLRHSWEERTPDGTVLGQRISPIERVGLYVPGGTAFYPSSVLMNLVPARVAGVREIVMVSPPSFQGSIHPLVLAAARVAGATRVFRVGGAQAIAALAYGTETIPAVLKIAGPGNIYVTLAKRLVSTVCDIDKEAGPSEIVVIADGQAEARLVALELLAQAEHDADSVAILITDSSELIDRVEGELSRELETLPRARIASEAFASNGRAYLVRDIEAAAELANEIAPEHLSIQTSAPRRVFDAVRNVGCAVLGAGTSVAAGDYGAGPNHILPTGRRARFASPLSAEDFRKVTSVISYSRAKMAEVARDVALLARAEGLEAHARAAEARQ